MTAPGMEVEGRLRPAAPSESSRRPPRTGSRARLLREWSVVLPGGLLATVVLGALATPVLLAVGWLDPWTPAQHLLDEFGLPEVGASGTHWLGVEPGLGRDVLSRLWVGTAVSLGVAGAATLLAVTLGVVVGLVSGMRGGWVDGLLGRLVDLTLAFPQLLLLVALDVVAIAFLAEVVGLPEGNPSRAVYVVLVLGLFGWTGVARVVRSQVLLLREQEFVLAARAFGASEPRVWVREVLPNLWSSILVQATLLLPAFVAAEAAVGYLGVGIQAPTPTLGNLVQDALRYAETAPLYFFAPAVVVASLVVALNLLGDALRDALDPRAGGRS